MRARASLPAAILPAPLLAPHPSAKPSPPTPKTPPSTKPPAPPDATGMAHYKSLKHNHDSRTLRATTSLYDPPRSALHASVDRIGRMMQARVRLAPAGGRGRRRASAPL